MNSDIQKSATKQLVPVSKEIQDAIIELSDAAQDYEKRRKAAQHRLTLSQGKMSTLISLMQS